MPPHSNGIPTLWLVFGGSCFMGRALVTTLLRPDIHLRDATVKHDFHDDHVCVLNRGNTYWGSSLVDAVSGDGGSLQRLHASRLDLDDERSVHLCAEQARHLVEHLKPLRIVVVAFSMDEPTHAGASFAIVHAAMEAQFAVVHRRACRYILISSDSAYDPAAVRSSDTDAGGVVEDDASLRRTGGQRADEGGGWSYGVRKAAIERQVSLLVDRSRGGVSLTVLRLPDVFGPHDDSARWWATMLWSIAEPERCYLPASMAKATVSDSARWWATMLWSIAEPERCYLPASMATATVSVVYSADVVKAILQVAAADAGSPSAAASGAFHVVTANVTLAEWVT